MINRKQMDETDSSYDQKNQERLLSCWWGSDCGVATETEMKDKSCLEDINATKATEEGIVPGGEH